MATPAPPTPPPPFLPPDEKIRQEFVEQQVKVEAFLFATVVIFTTILVLGRFRSQGNSLMKMCSTYLFMGAAYLVSYIPGLMNQSSHANDLYALWFAFVAYLASLANSNSCYTLGDNEDRKKRLVVDYSIAWPLIIVSLYKNLASPVILVPIVVIFWIVVLKLRERSYSLSYATNSTSGLAKTTKVISQFIKYQKEGDDATNSSCKYLVAVRDAHRLAEKQPKKTESEIFESKKVITLDQVLHCEQNLLKSKEGMELKDTCFSFAMFWLLLAKIAGYKNVDAKISVIPMLNTEYKHQQLQQQQGQQEQEQEQHQQQQSPLPLLQPPPQPQPQPNTQDRLFRLVEEELEFLYEYLFTNSYASYSRGLLKKLRDLSVTILFLWLTLPLLVEYLPQDHNIIYVVLWGHVLDIGFTRFVVITIIVIELVHMAIFITSKWAKVIYTCVYLQKQHRWETKIGNLLERVIKFICHVPRPKFSCFGKQDILGTKKLSQYSITNCYDSIPIPLWAQCWIGSYFELPRMGQAGTKYVDVTPTLKNTVVNCMEINQRVFTKGVASLERNKVREDIVRAYAKDIECLARTILIWHIATSELESDVLHQSSSLKDDNDFQVATIFSKYCAYLVAFIPQMLPDHVYTTQCEFDEVVNELLAENKANASVSILDDELPIQILNEEESIVGRGRKLKGILKDQHNLWKTLAEFWAEMLLFLALSDHSEAIEAHINRLCIGGEFITHLWALLTHEGCSKKDN